MFGEKKGVRFCPRSRFKLSAVAWKSEILDIISLAKLRGILEGHETFDIVERNSEGDQSIILLFVTRLTELFQLLHASLSPAMQPITEKFVGSLVTAALPDPVGLYRDLHARCQGAPRAVTLDLIYKLFNLRLNSNWDINDCLLRMNSLEAELRILGMPEFPEVYRVAVLTQAARESGKDSTPLGQLCSLPSSVGCVNRTVRRAVNRGEVTYD